MKHLLLAGVSFLALTIDSRAQSTQPALTSVYSPASGPNVFQLQDPLGDWVPVGTFPNGGQIYPAPETWVDSFKGPGVTDCAAALAASTYAQAHAGGKVHFSNRKYTMGNPCHIAINTSLYIEGEGWFENNQFGTVQKPIIPGGTWLEISDPNNNLFDVGGGGAGTQFHSLAFSQAALQANPNNAGWAPVVMPYVVNAHDTGGKVSFRDIFCYAVYDCIRSFNMGRLDIVGLFGQAFDNMIYMDDDADVNWIDLVHDWGFWSYANPVMAWEQAHADTIRSGRVDSPMFGRIFSICQRSMIHIFNDGYGTTNRWFASELISDHSQYGVWVDSTNAGTNGVVATWGHVGMLDHMGADCTTSTAKSIPGSNAIQFDSINNFLQIDQLRTDIEDGPAVMLNQPGGGLTIGSVVATNWGFRNAVNNVGQTGTVPWLHVPNVSTNGVSVRVRDFVAPTPISAGPWKLSDATSDWVNFQYIDFSGLTGDWTTDSQSKGVQLKGQGELRTSFGTETMTTTGTGAITINSAADAILRAGVGYTALFGAGAGSTNCGLWAQVGYLFPGKMDASGAGCPLSLGTAAYPFQNLYLNASLGATDAYLIDNNPVATYSLGVTATATPSGANIMLYGNGTVTPRKYIGAQNGLMAFRSNNETTVATMDDSGNFYTQGNYTAVGDVLANQLKLGGGPYLGWNGSELGFGGQIDTTGYKLSGLTGFTGVKTAGSCSFNIQGGIIINVTGC